MKAIILSAGQGKRLLPLTESLPKCLLSIGPGVTLLSWQLSQLAEAGIDEVVVVTGFHAEKVAAELERGRGALTARALYNPHYAVTDNLASVAHAAEEMDDDFLLINGDTLFTADVVRTLLGAEPRPIRVTVSRKERYDSDDMKVILRGGALAAVSKGLPLDEVDAESIGMILFRDEGVGTFRAAVTQAAASEEGRNSWYLSVVDALAKRVRVDIAEVPAGQWCEVDFPVDLQRARDAFRRWSEGAAGDIAVAASS